MSNPMREIRIEKVTLNIGCGKTVKPAHAKTILERLTGKKVVIVKTKKRSTFGVGRGKPIGAKVTIRKDYDDLLKRLFEAVDNQVLKSSFDENGNLSFGIKEYIVIPGMEYDPEIGLIGMDVCITLERPGFSIKRKRISKKIGKKHRITKDEAMEFLSKKYGVRFVDKIEREYY